MRLAAYYQDQAKKLQEKQKHEEDVTNYYEEHAPHCCGKNAAPSRSARQLADYYRLAAKNALGKAAQQRELAQATDSKTQ